MAVDTIFVLAVSYRNRYKNYRTTVHSFIDNLHLPLFLWSLDPTQNHTKPRKPTQGYGWFLPHKKPTSDVKRAKNEPSRSEGLLSKSLPLWGLYAKHRFNGASRLHVAVGALVPTAADGGLEDIGVGLGRRAVYFAGVAHVFSLHKLKI